MINLDISVNRKQNKKQDKKNDPLGTAGGFNIARELEEIGLHWAGENEGEDNRDDREYRNDEIINIDYELSHMQTPLPKNMPPQNVQPQPEEYDPGHLSGIPRAVANYTGAAIDYGGQVILSNAALLGTELTGAVNAVPEVTILGENGLFELSPNIDKERPLKDTPHGWLPPEVQQKIAAEHWRAGAAEIPAWLGAKWKSGMNALDQWINGTDKTFIDEVTHGGGTATGFDGASAAIKAGVDRLIKGLPPGDPRITVLKVLLSTMEAGTEAGGFIIDKYSKDPSILRDPDKLVDIAQLAGMDFTANAIPDFLLDTVGDYIGSRIPVTGMLQKFAKGAFGELIKENIQEAYQTATERAMEKTFQSGNFSVGNFWDNLTGEYKNILFPYTDEQNNQHSGYLWEQMPEVSASTALSTIVMGALGLPNPRQRGHILTQKGRQTMVDNSLKEDLTGHRDIYRGKVLTNDEDLLGMLMPPDSNEDIAQESYERLKKRRDELKARIEQLYDAYASIGDEADTDIEAMSYIHDMERELQEVEGQIGLGLGTYRATKRSLKNVSDALKSWAKYNKIGAITNPVQDDAKDFFPDIRLNVPAEPPEEKVQQSQSIPPIVDVDEIQQVAPEGLQPQSTQTQVAEPDLLPDTPRRQNNGDTLLRDLGFQQDNSINEYDDVDDEPDEWLDDSFDEQYNQSNPTSETNSDDGSRSIGNFVFSTSSNDYNFNVVSTRVSNNPNGVNNAGNVRMDRYRGQYIEIRNKRGKVIATYYPYLGTFSFSQDVDRKHSAKWKQAFKNSFRNNLSTYLNNGNFNDETGNLKPDGAEGFRQRWDNRIASDSNAQNAFYSNEVQQEDIDVPNIGTLSVSYQNGEGREVKAELSAEIGNFGNDMPEHRQYYGRHINIRDKYGNIVARYAPHTGKVKFSKDAETGYMRKAIMEQLRRKAKSLMKNAGFLDENGRLITDGNEGYRERRNAANDTPSYTLTQQETPAMQQDNSTQTQDTATSMGEGLGSNNVSETYNQEGAQSWADRAKGWVSGLLGKSEANAASKADTSAPNTPDYATHTETINYRDSNGNTRTLTARTGEFSDDYADEKQYFGRYIEYTDENGNVVARYSPYTKILQVADGVQDADGIRNAILQDYQRAGRKRLQSFGYLDEHGKLIDDGNEEFRHKYRTRLDTNLPGSTIHPINNKKSTGKRVDNRTFWRKVKDSYSEGKGFRKVRDNIYEQILKAYDEVAEAQAWDDTDRKKLNRTYKANSRAVAHLAASSIRGFAHSYGMGIEEFYRDGMHFSAVFNPEENESRGFMNFIPAKLEEKVDKATGEKSKILHPAEMVLNLTSEANTSTAIHEFLHSFRREMEYLVTTVNDLPQGIYDDFAAMNRWLGISDIDFSKPKDSWTKEQQERYTNAQEKWASAGEQYFATGQAPSFGLRSIFNKFKTWMASVYGAIKNIRYLGEDKHFHEVEITPETRKFFDNLFKDVPYVPSEEGRQARLAIAKDTSRGSKSEGFYRQAVSGQNKEVSLGRQNSIKDLLNVMHTETGKKNSGQVWADYAKVSQEEAKRISEATGLNIDDRYVHTIIGSAVTHTLNRHGEGNEKLEAQLPITDTDFERIPDIIRNPDEIRRGNEKVTGGINDTIVYKKRINGHILVVEEVRTGRRKLAFHTMRKTKTGYDYDLSNEAHPVVKESAKSQVITSDNDPTPEVRFTNALSTKSVQSSTSSVNSSNAKNIHIERSNDTFVSQEDIERFEQLAYQGTGRIILNNEFSLEYIGTGEGNQAVAWGLYFAQNPKVAEDYKRYGRNISVLNKYGQPISGSSEAIELLKDYLSHHSKEELKNTKAIKREWIGFCTRFINSMTKELMEEIGNAPDQEIANIKNDIVIHKEILRILRDKDISFTGTDGNVYKADIPENDTLLGWDAEEQPEKVQKGIQKVIAKLEKWNVSSEAIEKLRNTKTGEDFYRALTNAVKPLVEKGRLNSKKHGGIITRSDMAASLLLNQAGIPGLRYWDVLTRQGKSDTHNFVIWNTDMIKLLGLTEDSDEGAKKYFEDTARAKRQGSSETYRQVVSRQDDSQNYLAHNNSNTTSRRIGRSNNTFVSHEDIERYNQLAYQLTEHINPNNRFSLEYVEADKNYGGKGWGLHFVKNLGMAKLYKELFAPNKGNVAFELAIKYKGNEYLYNSVSDSSNRWRTKDGKRPIHELQDILYAIADAMGHQNNPYDAIDEVWKEYSKYTESDEENDEENDNLYGGYNPYLEILDGMKVSNWYEYPDSYTINTYVADIPENDALLNWDASISEQPEKVKTAILKVIAKLEKWNVSSEAINKLKNAKTGEAFYHALEDAVKPLVEKGRLNSRSMVALLLALIWLLHSSSIKQAFQDLDI